MPTEVRRDENSIYEDHDDDDVCTFDENNRFKDVFDGSTPAKSLFYLLKDSDLDGTNDLDEIWEAYN